jgi:hypothetical protein
MATEVPTGVHGPTRARIEQRTLRTDRWWLYPLTKFVVFAALMVFACWRAFAYVVFFGGAFLSPLFWPCVGVCV